MFLGDGGSLDILSTTDYIGMIVVLAVVVLVLGPLLLLVVQQAEAKAFEIPYRSLHSSQTTSGIQDIRETLKLDNVSITYKGSLVSR